MRKVLTAPIPLIVLIAVQSFCALFFLMDVVTDWGEIGGKPTSHLLVEGVAAGTLALAILFELRMIIELMQRKARLEKSLKDASRAVFEVIDDHFDLWALSPAERDVAGFLVKGFSTGEIASLRGNKEGTIKAHLNAIYRKSGTRNRAELMSVLIDRLIDAEPKAAAADQSPA